MVSKKKLKMLVLGAGLLSLLIITMPFWAVHVGWIKDKAASTGPIGDSFGGFWGPGVGLIGAIVTFLAFYIQYEANEQQREDIGSQAKNWKIERFENRYFELLSLHKENVTEMTLATGVTGRDCFKELYEEFKSIKILIDRAIQQKADEGTIVEIDRMRLAYLIYYYGIGMDKEHAYFDSLSREERDIFIMLKYSTANEKLAYKNGDIMIHNYKYPPYEGHSGKLGVYYRHLHQVAKYITGFKDFSEANDKYQFMGTLRDQISEFEQLMLYYNGTVLYPEEWKEFFTKYRLIKNVPVDPFDPQSSPLSRYEDAMVVLWLTDKKRLFTAQKDIGQYISTWIDRNPEEFKKLVIHEEHYELQPLQREMINRR